MRSDCASHCITEWGTGLDQLLKILFRCHAPNQSFQSSFSFALGSVPTPLECSNLVPVATAVTSSWWPRMCHVWKWNCGPTWTMEAGSAFQAKQQWFGPCAQTTILWDLWPCHSATWDWSGIPWAKGSHLWTGHEGGQCLVMCLMSLPVQDTFWKKVWMQSSWKGT